MALSSNRAARRLVYYTRLPCTVLPFLETLLAVQDFNDVLMWVLLCSLDGFPDAQLP